MKINVNKQKVGIIEPQILVSGTVNEYEVEFVFSADWDEYSIKTAVFEVKDGAAHEVLLVENKCIIPWEALIEEGFLKIGCYGVNGQKTRPTVYTEINVIHKGVKHGNLSSPQSDNIYEQLVSSGGGFEPIIDEWHDFDPYSNPATGTNVGSKYRFNKIGMLEMILDWSTAIEEPQIKTLPLEYRPLFDITASVINNLGETKKITIKSTGIIIATSTRAEKSYVCIPLDN